MARIIYSGLVTEIKGKVGGTVFQSNAYGFTCKNRPNMIRPNSLSQKQQQIYFSQAVRAWNALTAAQRADWNTWAATYPQYAKNNPSSQLSGFAVFVRRSVLIYMSGSAGISNPAYDVYDYETASPGLVNAAGVLTLTYNFDIGNGDWAVGVYASHNFASSQNFLGSRLRYMLATASDEISSVMTAAYVAQYGKVPDVGDDVFIGLSFQGVVNGQVQALQTFRVTVA